MSKRRITVFCGAGSGNRPEYAEAARQFATALVNADIGLVYGGAKIGLMGEMADRMLELGGEVIGVMPTMLIEKEVAHTHLSHMHVVSTMSERKILMTKLADAFVMLPGGPGSLDEFFEIVTLARIGVSYKPYGILNVANYFDTLIHFLDHSVTEGFFPPLYREKMLIDTCPQNLLSQLVLTLSSQADHSLLL